MLFFKSSFSLVQELFLLEILHDKTAPLLGKYEFKTFSNEKSNLSDDFTKILQMCRGSCYNNNSTEKSLFKTIAEIKNFAILETIQNIRMQISEII